MRSRSSTPPSPMLALCTLAALAGARGLAAIARYTAELSCPVRRGRTGVRHPAGEGPHRHRRHQCRPGQRRCELPQLSRHGQDLPEYRSRALAEVHELVEVPRLPVRRRGRRANQGCADVGAEEWQFRGVPDVARAPVASRGGGAASHATRLPPVSWMTPAARQVGLGQEPPFPGRRTSAVPPEDMSAGHDHERRTPPPARNPLVSPLRLAAGHSHSAPLQRLIGPTARRAVPAAAPPRPPTLATEG